MTVFISHAPADQNAAEALESLLERRGQFVERDDGQVALAPVEPHDIVVALISEAFAADENKLRLTLRALDAWSVGRVILARLDGAEAPIGLRDLPVTDASEVDARDGAWADVAVAIQKLAGSSEPMTEPAPAKRGGGLLSVVLHLVLLAPGLFALAASVSIWLANRIGPTPGGMPELVAGIDGFGRAHGLPGGLMPILFAAALLLMIGVLGRLAIRVFRPHRKGAQSERVQGIHVSAAPQDRARAAALLAGAREAGAMPGAAASISAAEAVVVMCSAAAYQSDAVKRDLFLAERGGKRITPIFLDAALPPEDFSYFFAADAGVALHQAPAAEQARLLAQALGASARESEPAAPAVHESQSGPPAAGA